MVRDDEKMERRTAGVTGIRLEGSRFGVGCRPNDGSEDPNRTFAAVTVGVEDVEVDDRGMVVVSVTVDGRSTAFIQVRMNFNSGKPDDRVYATEVA